MGQPTPTTPRLPGIDLLRGMVMLVMLLDHTRDFVHREGLSADPMDPATTHGALYFTRWITHFCAPTFVLLAGLSARLSMDRGHRRASLPGFLVRRGSFLIALELLVLRPLIWFQFDYSFLAHLQVIWAIGASMCGLGFLLWLRLQNGLIGGLGLAIVAGHNLLGHTALPFADFPSWRGLWLLLHEKGGLAIGGEQGPIAFVQYPLLPWLGVLLCGYGLAAVFAMPVDQRRRWLLGLGIGGVALFLLLRGLRLYGDPDPWQAASAWPTTMYSFLRVEKYPPSLQFLLMTLGPALVALSLCERVRADGALRPIIALGRAPLFFYVMQWPIVHLVSRLFQWIAGQPIGWDSPNPLQGGALPPDCGFSLPIVYLAYGVALLALAPLSLAFARYKRSKPSSRLLRYL